MLNQRNISSHYNIFYICVKGGGSKSRYICFIVTEVKNVRLSENSDSRIEIEGLETKKIGTLWMKLTQPLTESFIF